MLTDKEIRGLFELAYRHCREELGYFPRPKLVIKKGKDRLNGNFWYLQGGEIHVNSRTNDPMYQSLKHELVHCYIDYIDTHHKGIFTTYCKQVGGIYAR